MTISVLFLSNVSFGAGFCPYFLQTMSTCPKAWNSNLFEDTRSRLCWHFKCSCRTAQFWKFFILINTGISPPEFLVKRRFHWISQTFIKKCTNACSRGGVLWYRYNVIQRLEAYSLQESGVFGQNRDPSKFLWTDKQTNRQTDGQMTG